MAYEARETAVHKSLLEPKTMGGVEARLAILNGTMFAALTMGLESIIVLPIGVLTHMLLRKLTERDPHIMRIYAQYRVFGDVYDPWARRNQRTNLRPKGFSRGVLC